MARAVRTDDGGALRGVERDSRRKRVHQDLVGLDAVLVGGLGLLPSANIGDATALFEPVHGTAPDIAGEGVANPLATVLSAAMLLDHLGYGEESERVETAVETVLAEGPRTADLGGDADTKVVTQAVINEL